MKYVPKGICSLLLVPMFLLAHDMSLHMKIAAETFNIWEEYDPEFYNRLVTPAQSVSDSVEKMMTYKFYYVGATLPDLFFPYAQSSIRKLINKLYEQRGNLLDPFYIRTYTKDDVQTPIEFPPNANSHNLEKLSQMVVYACSSGWTPYEKAMIYGAYVHAIHDMYATFIQASRFGYGKCYDSDCAMQYDILRYGELYHELFSQTHIQGSWIRFINPLYCEVRDPNGAKHLQHGSCCFYREYTTDASYFRGWQDLVYEPILRYVEASNAVGWGVTNLTHNRLRSYLHGWGIVTFLLYGYKHDGSSCGGMFSHPDWSIEYLVDNFWYNIGSEFYEPWLFGLLPNCVQDWLKRTAWENIVIMDWLKHAYAPDPWYEYFQTTQKLQELWNGLPDTLKTPEAQQEFEHGRENLQYWQDTPGNHILEPRYRASYVTEASTALAMKQFYKESINQGPVYLDHNWNGLRVWTTARKAGLLGGLYDVISDVFARQPGIIDLHYFANHNNTHEHVYATLVTEDTPFGGVEWDMFVFPSVVDIDLYGKDDCGNIEHIETQIYSVDEIERKQGDIEVNLDSLHTAGVEQVHWEIHTYNQSNNSQLMLSADYRDAYHESPMVYDNILYKSWFNSGNPLRKPSQDPIANPLKYWPCVLRVFGLHKPTSLTTAFGNSSELLLKWTDHSGREDGFKIARMTDNGVWNLDHACASASSGAGSQVLYTDTVSLCHKYQYKLRAYDDDNRNSEWSDSVCTVHGSIAESENTGMSAYNNGRKIVTAGNTIYLVHAEDEWPNRAIVTLKSTDCGKTYQEVHRTGYGLDSHAAIAVDSSGNVYVVWGRIAWTTKGTEGWYRSYICRYYKDSVWNETELYSEKLNELDPWTPPEDSIAAPSITTTPDSGFVAFKIKYHKIHVTSFPLDNPNSSTHHQEINGTGAVTEYASIGYDKGGRLVLASHEYPDYIRLYYRKIGSDTWQNLQVSEDIALGSPSLWTGTKELWIAAPTYDQGLGLHYYHITWYTDHMVAPDTAHTMVVEAESLQQGSVEPRNTNLGDEYYVVSVIERIGDCDYDTSNGIVGYGSLASPNEALWQSGGDIMYSRRDSTGWITPQNLSNTVLVSSFAQGIQTDSDGGVPQLLVFWTENVDQPDGFYLIRDILDRPHNPDPPDGGGPQVFDQQGVKVFSFRKICPNPSSRQFWLNFTSPDERNVTIKLYDIAGRLVDKICEQRAHIGINNIVIPTESFAAGVYFLDIKAGDFRTVKKVTLFK